MAYFSQEKKKEVAPKIKSILKKYKMKGTISVDNHSTLEVNLKEGSLDFKKFYELVENEYHSRRYGGENVPAQDPYKWTYVRVNHYDDSQKAKKLGFDDIANFLDELLLAMRSAGWYDESDIQSDYFHIAYYTDINIGKWNQPYKLI
jgi:hypothetical protein